MDLKLKEVALMLCVSQTTIYRWIKAEAIPYYRIKEQYRFKKEEIEAWIESNRFGPSLESFKPVDLVDPRRRETPIERLAKRISIVSPNPRKFY